MPLFNLHEVKCDVVVLPQVVLPESDADGTLTFTSVTFAGATGNVLYAGLSNGTIRVYMFSQRD